MTEVNGKFCVTSAYLSFFDQPEIKEFIKTGGKVFAATEGRTIETVKVLLNEGHRYFAEKYLQEAERKFSELKKEYTDIHLSYFGKLQTNKISRILQFFDTVESVSRPVEVDYIKRERETRPVKTREFFIQWNIGEEPQKNGASECELSELLAYCHANDLDISGLMIIPPRFLNPQEYFMRARTVADSLGIKKCQMGFSEDFSIAIKSGADRIRIARLLFDNNF